MLLGSQSSTSKSEFRFGLIPRGASKSKNGKAESFCMLLGSQSSTSKSEFRFGLVIESLGTRLMAYVADDNNTSLYIQAYKTIRNVNL